MHLFVFIRGISCQLYSYLKGVDRNQSYEVGLGMYPDEFFSSSFYSNELQKYSSEKIENNKQAYLFTDSTL